MGANERAQMLKLFKTSVVLYTTVRFNDIRTNFAGVVCDYDNCKHTNAYDEAITTQIEELSVMAFS
jgi:methylmalonyl-CoA mutase N-terminal domain/subunit